METIVNDLYYSSGMVALSLIAFCAVIVLNILKKQRTLLLFSFLIFLGSVGWHFLNNNKLRQELTSHTCDRLDLRNSKICFLLTPVNNDTINLTVTEKTPETRLEKFYREIDYGSKKQVLFKINEKCDFGFFCKYDYKQFMYEFDVQRMKLKTYLNGPQDDKIYFE